MARDRTYEMGCNCDKRLLWCDGSCMNEDDTIWNEEEEEEGLNKNPKNGIWILLALGVLVLIILYYGYFR